MRTLGILGGSGISHILKSPREHQLETPFGAPSGPVLEAELGGVRVLLLKRHGPGHKIPPHRINYRANICALRQLGAEQIVSLSAVGSLREDLAPGHVVICDQYIDLTKSRVSTFFDGDDGVVAHVGFGDPACPHLIGAVTEATRRAGGTVHRGGTYVCMEGPQFSTRAESSIYRSWGASVIGMTAMPEAKLAREAGLPYVTVAFVTDYDSWRVSETPVTVDEILTVLGKNGALAERIVAELPALLPDPRQSPAWSALAGAVISEANGKTMPRISWLFEGR